MGETAPFWRFSAASYPDLEKSMAIDDLAVKANHSLNGDASTASRVCMFVLLRRFYMLLISLPAWIIIFLLFRWKHFIGPKGILL